jgi:hypothetical protein
MRVIRILKICWRIEDTLSLHCVGGGENLDGVIRMNSIETF